MLEEVSKALNIPKEAIENFTEDAAVSYIANTFSDNQNVSIGNYGTYNFNPIDKWIEALEENKRLVAEQKELYERLLKAEQEKVEILGR